MDYVEAIRDGQIVRVSEDEAKEEGLFVITKPTLKPAVHATPAANDRVRPVYSLSGNNVKKDLIHNFHWEIMRVRRMKNLSRRQFAMLLGVPEDHVKMLEQGELPRDDYVLINKIEHFLGINLKKKGAQTSVPVQQTVVPEHLINKKDVSLADLQRAKEEKNKQSKSNSAEELIGGDIELIE